MEREALLQARTWFCKSDSVLMKYTTARGEETGRGRAAAGGWRIYGFGCFFGVVFGVVFSSLLDVSKTILEPNMAPT